jgi:hypothetical protein
MSKVIFRKHPLDTNVKEGESFALDTKTLSTSGLKVVWEANVGEGWEEVGTGKTYKVSEATKADAGNYRCVIGGHSSRVAKVSVDAVAPAPTKENDVFIEILESTGKDAKPEVIKKASKAISKKLPESLKV